MHDLRSQFTRGTHRSNSEKKIFAPPQIYFVFFDINIPSRVSARPQVQYLWAQWPGGRGLTLVLGIFTAMSLPISKMEVAMAHATGGEVATYCNIHCHGDWRLATGGYRSTVVNTLSVTHIITASLSDSI